MKKLFLSLCLALLVLGPALPARAVDYDPYARDGSEAPVSDALRPRLNAIYAEPLPLLGATCLVPRDPEMIVRDLEALIGEHPEEIGLFYERARVNASLSRFDDALDDFKTYLERSTDQASALRALADFYGDRLKPKEQLETLTRLFDAWAKDPAANRKALGELISEMAGIARDQLLDFDEPSYRRRFVTLYPDDAEAALDYLRSLFDQGEPGKLEQDILQFAADRPDQSERFIELLAEFIEGQGQSERADRAFLDRLGPDARPELFNAFFSFLEQHDRLRDFSRRLQEAGSDPPDRALRFYLDRYQGDQTAAAAGLDDWLHDLPPQSADDYRRFAAYARRCGRPELAARLLYNGLLRARPDRREPWWKPLVEALLAADSPAFPDPGRLSGLYEVRVIDPGPGVEGGILSLLANGSPLGRTLDDLDRAAGRRRNFQLAINLRDLYAHDYPDGPARSGLDLEIIERFQQLGDWESVGREAEAFTAAHPEDEGLLEVTRQWGHALFELDRIDEGKTRYDRALELAAGTDQYLPVLVEYASRLSAHDRKPEALALYWRELDRHPDDDGLYRRFLDFISSFQLEDERIKVLERAVTHLKGSAWRTRLARYYLRQRMDARYRETLDAAVAALPGTEVRNFIEEAVSGYNQRAAGLKAALFEEAVRRFPRNDEFLSARLRYGAAAGPQGACRSTDCPDEVLRAAKHALMDNHRLAGEPGRIIIDELLRNGPIDSILNGLLSAPDPNPAQRYLAALILDRLSRYEQSAPSWQALAERYPAGVFFQETLADRLTGLAKVRPGRFGDGTRRAIDVIEKLNWMHPADRRTVIRLGELAVSRSALDEAQSWWDKLIDQAPGSERRYLEVAQIDWDYFQYQAAAERIRRGRDQLGRPALYSFELGAILEDAGDRSAAVREYARGLASEESGGSEIVDRLRVLARFHGAQDDVDQAFRELAATRPLDPAPVRAWVGFLEAMDQPDRMGAVITDAVEKLRDRRFLLWAQETLEDADQPEAEEKVWRRLIELDPEDFDSRLGLLRFYGRTGQVVKLEDRAKELRRDVGDLPRKSDQVRRLIALADQTWSVKLSDLSLECLRSAAALAQGDDLEKVSLNLAGKLEQSRSYLEAGSALEPVLARKGWDPDLYQRIVRLYAARKDFQGILGLQRRMKSAIEQSNLRGSARRDALGLLQATTARSLLKCDRPAEAVDYFIEWINLDPRDVERLREALAAARRHDLTDRLIKYYRDTAAEANKDFRWSLVLGRLLGFQGETEGAVAAYNAAIRNEPREEILYTELIRLELARGDLAAAGETSGRLGRLDPLHDEPLLTGARYYLIAGQETEARQLLDKLRGSSHFGAARACESAGRPDLAVPFLESAVNYHLERADRLVLSLGDLQDLTRIYAEAGRIEDAFTLLDRAADRLAELARDPANRYTAYNLNRSLDAVKQVRLENLPALIGQYGDRPDRERAAAWLAQAGPGLGPIDAYRFAANAGLTEEAARRLPAAYAADQKSSQRVGVPTVAGFWTRRLKFDRVLQSEDATFHQRADALGWRNRQDDLRALLLTRYGADESFDPRLLDLSVDPDREEILKAVLDDGRLFVPEANYLLRKGRPDLALRTLRSAPSRPWSLAKQLLVRLQTGKYDQEFTEQLESALRLIRLGARLTHRFDSTREFRGHEQAVVMVKFSEYLHRAGDRQQARTLALAALEDSPRDFTAYRYSGLVLESFGDHEDAAGLLQQALALQPGDLPTVTALALVMIEQENKEPAGRLLAAMAGATVDGDNDYERKFHQFAARLDLGFEAEAVAGLTEWIKRGFEGDDENGRAMARQGLDALARYQHLSSPTQPPSSFTALVNTLLTNHPEDVELFRRAIDSGWIEGADLDAAYERVIDTLREEEDLEQVRYWEDRRLAHWMEQGSYDQVLAALNLREVSLAPDQVPEGQAKLRAQALIRKGAKAQADEFFANWLNARRRSAGALDFVLGVYLEEGLTVEAARYEEEKFKDLLDDPLAAPEVYLGYARFLLDHDRSGEAPPILDRLVQSRPDQPDLLIQSAQVLETAGLYQQAAKRRETAGKLGPLDQDNRSRLIADLLKLGRIEDGRRLAEQLIESRLVSRRTKLEFIRSLPGLLESKSGLAGWGKSWEARAGQEAAYRDLVLLAGAGGAWAAGDQETSLRLLDAAHDANPAGNAAVDVEFRLRADHLEEAEAHAREALEAFPEQPDLRDLLALARLRQHKTAQALALVFTGGDWLRATDFNRPPLPDQGPVLPDYYQLEDLLGAELPLDLKLELASGLADQLAESGADEAARTILRSIIEYFDPGWTESAGEDEGSWIKAPPVKPPDPRTAEYRTRLQKLRTMADQNDRERAAALTIIPRLDNGIAWSDVDPRFTDPWSHFMQNRKAPVEDQP